MIFYCGRDCSGEELNLFWQRDILLKKQAVLKRAACFAAYAVAEQKV